jgi:hypothetical protein
MKIFAANVRKKERRMEGRKKKRKEERKEGKGRKSTLIVYSTSSPSSISTPGLTVQ